MTIERFMIIRHSTGIERFGHLKENSSMFLVIREVFALRSDCLRNGALNNQFASYVSI